VQTLWLHHGATFRMSLTAKAIPIQGTQLFTADPLGFVWTRRIRMFPGVWIDTRDRTVEGEGSLRVLLDDTVPLVDVRGPGLDLGSTLRFLAEMPWYPTAVESTPARSHGRQSTGITLVRRCALVISRSPAFSGLARIAYLCG
jgi:hypothetical protein